MTDLSKLNVTLVCCRKHTRASRPEAGEYSALFVVHDPETGQKGHFAYIFEWDKRDIDLEQLDTDNPALVCFPDDEGPCCYRWGSICEDTGVEPITHPDWDKCTIRAYG